MSPDTFWMPTVEANQFRRTLRQAGIQCRLIQGPMLGYWRVQALPDFPRPPEELFYAGDDPPGL